MKEEFNENQLRDREIAIKHLDKYSESLFSVTGIKELSLDDYWKIVNITEIRLSLLTFKDLETSLKRNRIKVVNRKVFKDEYNEFEIGEKVFVATKDEHRRIYKYKKVGQVVYKNDDYITVKFKEYSISILFATMKIREYLVM